MCLYKVLELLLKSIAQIRKFINPKLDICGILLTMADMRANFTKDIIAMIEKAYGEEIHIFRNHVPHSIRAAEACATGKSIFAHDPYGKVAVAYEALVRDLLACEDEDSALDSVECGDEDSITDVSKDGNDDLIIIMEGIHYERKRQRTSSQSSLGNVSSN